MLLKFLKIRLRVVVVKSRKRSSIRSCSVMDQKKVLIQRVERKQQVELRLWIKLKTKIELLIQLNLLELLKKVKPADKVKADSTDSSQWKKTRR
jgi:hypothetical protein